MNPVIEQLSASINVELANRVRALEAAGEKVFKLQTGEPDFNTPTSIIDSAYQAMLSGNTHYCASSGLAELKNVIADKLVRENHIHASAQNILITHGAVHAIYLISQALLSEQDEVIVIAPYWMPYKSCIEMARAKPVIVDSSHCNFAIPIVEIEKNITAKTKAIIINSPNNPSGAIYSKESLLSLAKLCESHQLYVISDEVYEDICFTEAHSSIAALVENNDRIISVFSLSKGYAMTGWRIGYLHANHQLVSLVNKLNQYIVTSICHFNQVAAITALTSPQVTQEKLEMFEVYASRRRFILDYIKGSWLERELMVPEGAFYCLINVAHLTNDTITFTNQLLDKYKVCFTPGEAFGLDDNAYIRMTFATDLPTITQALNILKQLGA